MGATAHPPAAVGRVERHRPRVDDGARRPPRSWSRRRSLRIPVAPVSDGRRRSSRSSRRWPAASSSTTPPVPSGCPAVRGRSTASPRPRRARRPRLGRAHGRPVARAAREADPPPPSLAGDPGLPLDGVARRRPHRVVGRPVGDRDARSARGRRRARRVRHPPRRHADGGRHVLRPSASGGSGALSSCRPTRTSEGSPSTSPRRRVGSSCCDWSAEADLVIENFTPRVLESFDLGWDVVHGPTRRPSWCACPPSASTARGGTGPASPRRWSRSPGWPG